MRRPRPTHARLEMTPRSKSGHHNLARGSAARPCSVPAVLDDPARPRLSHRHLRVRPLSRAHEGDSLRHHARGHRRRASRCSPTAPWASDRTTRAVLGSALNPVGSSCGCAPLCTPLVSACLDFRPGGSAVRLRPAFCPRCLRSPTLCPNPQPAAGPPRHHRPPPPEAVLFHTGLFPFHFA